MALAITPGTATASTSAVHLLARHPLHCEAGSLLGIGTTLRLGPLDQLVLPFIPVAVLFVYRQPDADSTQLIPLARLQRALCLLLDFYPHLTGRLQLNANDGTPEVSRLGSGAELLEAVCSTCLDDSFSLSANEGGQLRVTDLPEGGNAMLAPFDPSMEAVLSSPLLTVQHTRFRCGSVALGVRTLHTLCDADGFFQLVHDLCELYRELRASHSPRLVQPPHIHSALANSHDMTDEERTIALQFESSLFQLAPTTAEMTATGAADAVAPPSSAPVIGRVLRFSAAELSALKAHAGDATGDGWVSTFDALAAHLYQRVYVARAQCTRDSGADVSALSTDFLTPINCRRADRLNLHSRYFPNALLCHYFTLSSNTLATAPLSHIAKAVHDCVRQLSAQEVTSTLRWLAAQPDKSRVRQAFRYSNGGFMLSTWSKIDMQDGLVLDVDAQGQIVSPCLVQPPFTSISLMDGLGYLLPTRKQRQTKDETRGSETNGADVDVCLALAEPLWALLDRDPLFRRFEAQSVPGLT